MAPRVLDTPATDDTTIEEACVLTLDEHIETALAAQTMFGLGLGCEKDYQALVVLAEVSRRRFGHPPYDPTEKVNEILARIEEIRREQEEARARRLPTTDVFPAPDNGQVH